VDKSFFKDLNYRRVFNGQPPFHDFKALNNILFPAAKKKERKT